MKVKKLEIYDFFGAKISNPSKVFGGDTSSNGQSTSSQGADWDSSTGDGDEKPNPPKK